MRKLGLLVGCWLVGCAHAERLPIDVDETRTDGFEAWANVNASEGGVVTDVQFVKYGGGVSPVRVGAKRVDAYTVEFVFDYEPGSWRCASALAYRVAIAGLDAGSYELVVKVRDDVLARPTFVVPAGPRAVARGRVRNVGGAGC